MANDVHFKSPLTFVQIFSIIGVTFGAPNSKSEAYALHTKPCNETFPCNPEALLMCTAGQCQCESPSNQKYNKELDICLSSVGGHCTLPDVGPTIGTSKSPFPRQCIKNAHCVHVVVNESTKYTECRCDEGYIENSGGECVPGIGMPCKYLPNECNPLGMVVCKNERCGCLDKLQVYDQEIKRCVSPAGTHCKYDSMQLGCVKNAICYPFYYWIPPRCICKPGYYQTPSRTCAPEFLEGVKHLSEDL